MKEQRMTLQSFYRRFGIFLMLVLEFAIFTILEPRFISIESILNVGRQVSFMGIAAVGMTMVLLTGGIDISVGAMLAMTGVFAALLNTNLQVPLIWTILLAIGVGTVFGAVTGISIAWFNVPPLIATLAMQVILKGVAYVFNMGLPIPIDNPDFVFLGQGYIFEIIPLPLIFMILFFILGWWILKKTYIGRHLYAVGGNQEATRLAGINTKLLVAAAYTASGLFAAIAGVLMAGKMSSGQPIAGGDFPMDVLTATVLGGVSLFGGKGEVLNVLIGAFIMGFLTHGMVMLNISDYMQWIVKGIVLFLVVALSNINLKKD